MADNNSDNNKKTVGRRDFLAGVTVPVVAAMIPGVGAQQAATTSAGTNTVRVGIIGAGTNVRAVQIPGFNAVPDCEVVAVANRSLASSQRVADEFNIPKAYANWEQLLADDEIDAVLIGTWPYMHRELTIGSLESGKHVLCQARMANDATEAREMLAASRRYPHLVAQLVPTSTSYVIDNLLKRLLVDNYVGEVLSVEVQRVGRNFADYDGELDWRHNREFSGLNVMNLGSTYESMMRWFGPGNQVTAQTKIHVDRRRDQNGNAVPVALPDHVEAVYQLQNGAQVHMRFSETTGLSAGNQTWIHGSEGTIHVDNGLGVLGGRRGDSLLSPIANPQSEQAYYRVEQEFINAIRGIEPVTMNTFEIGVQYMDFTEAVHRSAESGRTVTLPLA
jgi:predicted dehydrogenase